MHIKTEKTHTLVLTDEELNTLRCFLDDALCKDFWEFHGERNIPAEIHDAAYKAVFGEEIGK